MRRRKTSPAQAVTAVLQRATVGIASKASCHPRAGERGRMIANLFVRANASLLDPRADRAQDVINPTLAKSFVHHDDFTRSDVVTDPTNNGERPRLIAGVEDVVDPQLAAGL